MCIELTTVMRQKDANFIAILNELRRGMVYLYLCMFTFVIVPIDDRPINARAAQVLPTSRPFEWNHAYQTLLYQ